MRLSILTSALFFLLSLSAWAKPTEDDFVIYEAQTHSAEELKKASQDLLNGARVSVLGTKVIVYGTRSQREGMLKLFQEIDHPLKMYTVYVRAVGKGAGTRDAHAVEGTVGVGGVGASSKSGVLKRRGGGSVGVGSEVGSVSVSAESGEEAGAGDTSQQLQVMDGGTGKIFSGSGLFPTAVDVRVRSVGKSSAHVEIQQSDVSHTGVQSIHTEINLPLNEWRTLGGIHTTDSGSNNDMLGKSKSTSSQSKDVQIKVSPSAP